MDRKTFNKIKIKRIIALISIIAITALIELGFNYHALTEKLQERNILNQMEVAPPQDGITTYQFYPDSGNGLYAGKIKLTGNFKKKKYQVIINRINAFDQIEEEIQDDYVNTWFSTFYTPVDCRIAGFSLQMELGEGEQLTGVYISNEPKIQWYRIFFFLAAFGILYCIVGEPIFRQKPEWFFLAFATVFGVLMILYGQTQYNGWDESVHFRRIYQMASGRTVHWNEAIDQLEAARNLHCNTSEEFRQLRHIMNEKANIATTTEERNGLELRYFSLPYVPQAIILRFGMALSLSFSKLYMLGKLTNLAIFLVAIFFSIRITKHNQIFLMFISLMPTMLFLASSYTYDIVIFALITLGLVIWTNESFVLKDYHYNRAIITAAILIVLGSLAKPVYLPVILLLLLSPQIRNLPLRTKKLAAGIGFICLLAGIALIGFIVWRALNGQWDFSDSRGGETSLGGQLNSMLHHPISSIRLFIREICNLDNFRNSGQEELNNFQFSNLMFLNYYWMGVMADKWSLLLIPVLLTSLFVHNPKEKDAPVLTKCQRGWICISVLCSVFLIWAALYLTFTPVGTDSIAGVQARYYIPLLYPLSLAISNRNIFIRMRYGSMVKLTMIAVWVFEVVSIYNLVLTDRLL